MNNSILDSTYLTQVIEHTNRVLNDIPFYKSYSNIKKVSSYSEFLQLPVITKEDYRIHWDEMINPSINKDDLIIDFTSGSTGQPLRVARTLSETNDARKTLWKYRKNWFPNSLTARRAEFGRNMRYFLKNPKELFLQKDNVLYVKGVVSKDLAPKYIGKLEEFQPEWFIGSASFLAQLARFIKEKSLNLKLQMIECTGEFLYEHLREELMDTFKCPVVNHYGAREIWPIAFECKEGSFHINENNVFLEILKDGTPVQLGEVGEVVVTSLRINSLPLLRYKLGDLGRIIKTNCKCGDKSASIELLSSRSSDYAVSRNGTRTGAYFFSTIFVDQILRAGYRGINNWQVIQKDYDEFHILICKTEEYSFEVEEIISKNIRQQFGHCRIRFDYVDHIPMHSSGKMKYFISEIQNVLDEEDKK